MNRPLINIQGLNTPLALSSVPNKVSTLTSLKVDGIFSPHLHHYEMGNLNYDQYCEAGFILKFEYITSTEYLNL